jgi:hypothetical protein
MYIFDKIKQLLIPITNGKSYDIEKNKSGTKSNQDLLEEIQKRIRELQRRGI